MYSSGYAALFATPTGRPNCAAESMPLRIRHARAAGYGKRGSARQRAWFGCRENWREAETRVSYSVSSPDLGPTRRHPGRASDGRRACVDGVLPRLE
jgi:hypothetical protein